MPDDSGGAAFDVPMLIGVISDTHGLLRPEALDALAGVEHIIHAGDIGSPEIVPRLGEIAPVTAIRGNVDTKPWAQALPAWDVVTLADRMIYVIHDLGDLDFDPTAAGIAVVVSATHTSRKSNAGEAWFTSIRGARGHAGSNCRSHSRRSTCLGHPSDRCSIRSSREAATRGRALPSGLLSGLKLPFGPFFAAPKRPFRRRRHRSIEACKQPQRFRSRRRVGGGDEMEPVEKPSVEEMREAQLAPLNTQSDVEPVEEAHAAAGGNKIQDQRDRIAPQHDPRIGAGAVHLGVEARPDREGRVWQAERVFETLLESEWGHVGRRHFRRVDKAEVKLALRVDPQLGEAGHVEGHHRIELICSEKVDETGGAADGDLERRDVVRVVTRSQKRDEAFHHAKPKRRRDRWRSSHGCAEAALVVEPPFGLL